MTSFKQRIFQNAPVVRRVEINAILYEMERLGCGVRWEPGRQNITYTHPNGKKVRDRKLHEEKYLEERMEREFELRQQTIAGGIEAA